VRFSRIITLAAAVVAAGIGSLGTPASAATAVWTVTNPNADGSVTAVSPSMTISNPAGTLVINCPSTAIAGGMRSGSSTYSDVGYFKGTTNNVQCTDQAGGSWTFFIPSPYPGNGLHATAFDAAAGRTTIVGSAMNIFVAGPSCGFEIYYFNGSYTNATSTLSTTSGTAFVGTIDGKPSCAGELNNLDTVGFSANFKVTPAVTITEQSQ
jgi:hypothetical protein